MSQSQVRQKPARIERAYPDSLTTRYAFDMLVTHTEHEFIIAFFEIIPPLPVDGPDSDDSRPVQAECVGRFVVSAARMEGFIHALKADFERFKSEFAMVSDGLTVDDLGLTTEEAGRVRGVLSQFAEGWDDSEMDVYDTL
jgi:hypothetical protein